MSQPAARVSWQAEVVCRGTICMADTKAWHGGDRVGEGLGGEWCRNANTFLSEFNFIHWLNN